MKRLNDEINRQPDGFVSNGSQPGFYFWLGEDAERAEAESEWTPYVGDVDEPELDFGDGEDDE